jgi:ParB family chromosome partitioning protein
VTSFRPTIRCSARCWGTTPTPPKSAWPRTWCGSPCYPADQFEAFRNLIDKGAGIADIAARFGTSESTVTKRLKLGRVSPAILDAYRAGSLGLEQVQAFAVSDDREAQERIFAACDGHRANPVAIRRALTEGEIPATDPRLSFIGMEAYEQAGGSVRRDLFDEEGGGYAQDALLLDALVTDKLAAIAETIRAEGWSWTHVQPQFGHDDRGRFHRCQPDDIELPEAEAAELERLEAEHDELLETQYDEGGEDDPAVTEQLEALGERISALEAKARAWTQEQMAHAGAIVSLSQNGEPEVHRGLIRPEDTEVCNRAHW